MASPEPVERIGPYELREQLGRGGMGAVHRAVDARTGQEVALKLLLAVTDERARRRQLLEGRALTRLRHRSVVSLLDVGEDHGRPWLALELVRGRSLEERLDREGALAPKDAARLAQELAAGLAHAHREGILHRDLKPANVLLPDDGGPPKLTDFGLAGFTFDPLSQSRLTRSGILMGTPGYWAPEQAAGRPDAIGPATDVYGLGAVLYAALKRQPPITGESLPEVLLATANRRPEPPGADPALDAIALRCLEKDPSDRYASAAELERELRRYLAGARPRRPRGPLVAGGLVIAVALVVAGLGVTKLLAPAEVQPPPARVDQASPAALEERGADDAARTKQEAVGSRGSTGAQPGDDQGAGPVELVVRRVIGERRRKHADDQVCAVAFTPDGRQVVSAGLDGVVRWWDAAGGPDGPAVATGQQVLDLALLPDGRALAAGTAGLVIVDPATRTVAAPFGADPDPQTVSAANAVELLPDGRVATAHPDGVLRLWTLDGVLASRKPLGLGALWDLALDRPRGRLLIVGNDQAAGGGTPTHGGAGWFHLATGVVSPVTNEASSFASRWWGGVPTEDGGAALCGEESDRSRGALLLCSETNVALQTTPARLNRVALRGRTLYGVEFSGAVTARSLGEVGGRVRELGRHARQAVVLAVDPEGRRLATGGLDGTVRLWDLALRPDGAVEGAAELSPPAGAAGAVRCLAPDGPGVAVALGSDGVLRRLDLATGRELLRRGESLGAGGWSLGHTPSLGVTGLVASGSKVVLELSDGRQQVTVNGLASLRVAAPREDAVAVVTVEGQVVFVRGREARPSRHLVHGTAQAIAWAGPDRVVVATREGALHSVTPVSGVSLAGFTGTLAALAAAPDGRWVAAGGEDGQLWWIVGDQATRDAPPALGGQAARLLAPSPDGRRLAAAARARLSTLDRLTTYAPDGPLPGSCAVVVLEAVGATRGATVGALTLPLTVDAPTALAWADARTLLVGTARGVVLVVDVPDGP